MLMYEHMVQATLLEATLLGRGTSVSGSAAHALRLLAAYAGSSAIVMAVLLLFSCDVIRISTSCCDLVCMQSFVMGSLPGAPDLSALHCEDGLDAPPKLSFQQLVCWVPLQMLVLGSLLLTVSLHTPAKALLADGCCAAVGSCRACCAAAGSCRACCAAGGQLSGCAGRRCQRTWGSGACGWCWQWHAAFQSKLLYAAWSPHRHTHRVFSCVCEAHSFPTAPSMPSGPGLRGLMQTNLTLWKVLPSPPWKLTRSKLRSSRHDGGAAGWRGAVCRVGMTGGGLAMGIVKCFADYGERHAGRPYCT